MAMPPFADPANLMVDESEDVLIPDNVSYDEIADRVVRGKLKLSREQLRLLIELLPYWKPN